MRPPELDEMFTTQWTRESITEVVNKGIGHLTQVCKMQYQTTLLLLQFALSEPPSLGPTT